MMKIIENIEASVRAKLHNKRKETKKNGVASHKTLKTR